MKHILTSLLILLVLAACSSSPTVVESDTGLVYPAAHLDTLRGMSSGNRDAQQHRYSDLILQQAGKPSVEHGVRYSGRVKLITWTHKRQPKYLALREANFGGLTGWQGPTPPSGFYGSQLTTVYLQ
jgi:hypothetical protein